MTITKMMAGAAYTANRVQFILPRLSVRAVSNRTSAVVSMIGTRDAVDASATTAISHAPAWHSMLTVVRVSGFFPGSRRIRLNKRPVASSATIPATTAVTFALPIVPAKRP